MSILTRVQNARQAPISTSLKLMIGAAGNMFATAVSMMLLNVTSILMVRLLGVEGRGMVASAILLPTAISYGTWIGLPVACAYFAKISGRDRDAVIGTARTLAVGISIIQMAIATAAILVFQDSATVRTASLVFLLFLPMNIFYSLHQLVLQADLRIAVVNKIRLIGTLVYFVFVCILYVFDVKSVLLVTVAQLAGALVWTVLYWRVASSRPIFSFDRSVSRNLLGYGARAQLGSTSPLETLRLDQLILALFLSAHDLGLYVIAMTFITANRLIGVSVGNIAFPVAIETAKNGARITKQLKLLLFATIGIATSISAFEIFYGRRILELFFGTDAGNAYPALRILVIASIFLNFRQVLADITRGFGYPGIPTITELISGISLAFIAYMLWSRGLQGVAWAVLISSVVSALSTPLLLWILSRQRSLLRPTEANNSYPSGAGQPSLTIRSLTNEIALPRQGILQVETNARAFSGGRNRRRHVELLPSLDSRYSIVALALVLTAALASIVAPLLVRNVSTYTSYLLLILALLAVPLFIIRLHRRIDYFEPIVISTVTCAVLYIIRPISDISRSEYFWVNFDVSDTYLTALQATALCIFGFGLGYVLVEEKWRASLKRRRAIVAPSPRIDEWRVLYCGIILTGLGLLFLCLKGLLAGGLHTILENRSAANPDAVNIPLISQAFMLCLPAFLLFWTVKGELKRLARLISVVPAAVIIVPAVAGGDRRYALPLMFAAFVFYYFLTGRRPNGVKMIIIGLMCFFVFLTPVQRARNGEVSYFTALSSTVQHPIQATDEMLRSQSTSLLPAFALEMHFVGPGKPISWQLGKASLVETVLQPIPRQVWSEKPQVIRNMVITSIWGMANASCVSMCPTFSALGTFYADFGMPGMVVGGLLLGALCRYLFQLTQDNKDDVFYLAAYSAVFLLPLFVFWEALSTVIIMLSIYASPILIARRVSLHSPTHSPATKSLLEVKGTAHA